MPESDWDSCPLLRAAAARATEVPAFEPLLVLRLGLDLPLLLLVAFFAILPAPDLVRWSA
jgi:hypothetical protein